VSGLTASLNATVAAAGTVMVRVRDVASEAVGGRWTLDVAGPMLGRRGENAAWARIDLYGAPPNIDAEWLVRIDVWLEIQPPRVVLRGTVDKWMEQRQVIADFGEQSVNPDYGPEAAADLAADIQSALMGSLSDWAHG
jgi:hypothetical protein